MFENFLNSNNDCSLKTFLEDNLPIITIIGVFGALSFFSINDPDEDIKALSVLLSIIVVFLFFYVLFDGFKRIFYNLKNNFSSSNFIEYLKKSVISFNLIIFLTSLSLFTWAFFTYLNSKTMIYFRVFLLLIIFFVSVAISVITIPYILFKENDARIIVGMWGLLSILITVVGYSFGLFDPTFLKQHAPRDIDTLVSLKMFVLFFLLTPIFLWFATFFKMLMLMYQRSQS